MSIVKVGAIQGDFPYPSPKYDYFHAEYCGEVDEILEHYVAPRLKKAEQLLSQAGEQGCDIVTTSEDLTGTANFLVDISPNSLFKELVERSQKAGETMLSAISKKYNMYVIGCYHNLVDNDIFNQAVIFDRNGDICGKYSKVQIPYNEQWQVKAGEDIPVFELDFGRIGISICYEMMFPEIMEVISLKGVQLVFHPTAGYGWYDSIGEATLRTRANDNDIYIITAKSYQRNAAGKSSVIDYWGQVLADAGFYADVVVTHTIDLSIKKSQPEWFVPSRMSGIPQMAARRKTERRPSLYKEITDESYVMRKSLTQDEKLQILHDMKKGSAHW